VCQGLFLKIGTHKFTYRGEKVQIIHKTSKNGVDSFFMKGKERAEESVIDLEN
jgi:hypothetical protein